MLVLKYEAIDTLLLGEEGHDFKGEEKHIQSLINRKIRVGFGLRMTDCIVSSDTKLLRSLRYITMMLDAQIFKELRQSCQLFLI